MEWWKRMSPIVFVSFIYWWNGINSVILIIFFYMFISFILEKSNRSKGNNNWSNFSNLQRSEILPESEISNQFHFTHVNVLLVITVFCNFYRVAYNARFETTSYLALIFDYNEKRSAKWASFWINFWRKRMFLLKHSCLCFLYLKYFRIMWIYARNEYKNEYIIFCKEHNFKSKKNKSRLPL